MPKPPVRIAASLAVAAALVLSASAPAQAHNYLVLSTPEARSTITEVPETFSVTTNEALLDLSGDGSGFAIEVTDAAGAFYGDGCTSITDSTLSTGASLGAAGDYRMLWQLVSSDGHTVSGEIDFTWAPPADAVASAGAETPPNCGGDSVAAPDSTTAKAVRSDAALGDVLWVGGAIAAVLIAGLVTLVVASRRRKA
jgi:copper resistance protein C